MKRLRKLIPVFLLVLAAYCMPVSAENTKNNAVIQWKANENQMSAGLTLAPTEEMINNAATTLQITLQLADNSGKLQGADVTFDGATAGKYRMTDYKYAADTKELNIFISDSKALFDETTKSCSIGNVNVHVAAKEYQVSITPVSIKFVNQSHVTEELKGEDLNGMGVTLSKSSGTDPGNPGNPDNPHNPDDSGNPDKPHNPNDSGNPDNPGIAPALDKAEDVVKEINNGQQSNIRYNIGKDAVVSDKDQKAIFKALKGKNKSVTFTVEDGGKVLYSFTFRGDQLTDENIVMNFGLKSGVSNSEIEKLLPKDSKHLILDFAHSGALPGPAEVKVYVGDKFENGQKLFLYYYNPDKKVVEPVQKDIVAADGYASFELTHCSTYVLTTKEVKSADNFPNPGGQTPVKNNDGGKKPANHSVLTGDTAPVALLVVIMAAAIIGIVWSILRKKYR